MLSNSSIQNQNVINSNNISGSSSGSLSCNSLTLTDGNNTTNLGPTNTTLNTLTVNGVSNFNSEIGANAGMQIRDISNNTFSQIFQSTNTLQIQTWSANGRIKLNTTGATAGVASNNFIGGKR